METHFPPLGMFRDPQFLCGDDGNVPPSLADGLDNVEALNWDILGRCGLSDVDDTCSDMVG